MSQVRKLDSGVFTVYVPNLFYQLRGIFRAFTFEL